MKRYVYFESNPDIDNAKMILAGRLIPEKRYEARSLFDGEYDPDIATITNEDDNECIVLVGSKCNCAFLDGYGSWVEEFEPEEGDRE